MQKNTVGSKTVTLRIISIVLAVIVLAAYTLTSYPHAYANFNSESVEQVIGVGRIQSVVTATTTSSDDLTATVRFETPAQLSTEPTEEVNQLAQPLDRSIATEQVEEAIENVSLTQRFGEPDADGWFTTKTSAYGPSSAGQFTALGTELTLTSMDIGVHINHIDLLGQYVELKYNGVILRCKIVDTGEMASDGRLFDLQPGVCTAFGAETPEFGWGIRTVQWRFAN